MGEIASDQVNRFLVWCLTVGKLTGEKNRVIAELRAAWERQQERCKWTYDKDGTPDRECGGIGGYCEGCGRRIEEVKDAHQD